jgi:hypothetical protein
MAAGVLAREGLPKHGELRAYRLTDRPELLLEVLREADGRAWQLRVPVGGREALTRLVREAGPALRTPERLAFDAEGMALLGEVALGPDDGLAAVERAFALWRRERLRTGWSWTIDLVLVPMEHGPHLCSFVQGALAAAETPPTHRPLQ